MKILGHKIDFFRNSFHINCIILRYYPWFYFYTVYRIIVFFQKWIHYLGKNIINIKNIFSKAIFSFFTHYWGCTWFQLIEGLWCFIKYKKALLRTFLLIDGHSSSKIQSNIRTLQIQTYWSLYRPSASVGAKINFRTKKSSVLDAIPLCKVRGVGSSAGVDETEKGNGPLSHRKITPLNDNTRR